MKYCAKINFSLGLINLFLLIILICLPSLSFSQTLKILTYNIRYDNPDDGENAWKYRKEEMTRFLKNQSPDIIGLQEVLHHQLEFLKSELSAYEAIGVGREDGKTKGEYSPVLFKTQTFKMVSFQTVWLSETPGLPSVGWDAALERIATIAILELKTDGRHLVVINTHFDHRGEAARKKSSELLSAVIEQKFSELPMIFMGDLNSEPETEAIKLLAANYQDTFSCTNRKGPAITFSGFTNITYETGPRIDYIFLKDFECSEFEILTPRINNRNLSDHLPVSAQVRFNRE